MKTAQDIIKEIISIGREQKYEEMESLNSRDSNGRLLWDHNEAFWNNICSELATEDIIAFLKAMVFADGRYKNFSTYSVTHYCLYMLFIIKERFGASNYRGYEDVLDWIFKNRSNTYLPYLGNIPLYVDSLAAFRKFSEESENDRKRKEINKKKEYEEAQLRKKNRKDNAIRNKEINLIAQARRNEQRMLFLTRLKSLGKVDILREIINDNNHSIDYYPEDFSLISDENIKELSVNERNILINKLNNSKGGWKILRKKLKIL